MFKPIQLSDSTVYVSAQDPAIDWDRIAEHEIETNEEIRASGDSAEQKRLAALTSFQSRVGKDAARKPSITSERYIAKDGEKLTRFVIGVVPPGDLSRIWDECRTGDNLRNQEMQWRCFLSGLRDIQNWGGSGEIPKKTIDGVEYVDPVWLKRTFAGPLRRIAMEVGQIIALWNQFGDEDAKN